MQKTKAPNKKIKNKVLAIVGPTGSGKTAWAKKLANKYFGKVISADSRQVYIGMDIGTGKDKTFPQDLIDILTCDKIYTVADFQKDANFLIEKYNKENKLPIITGGTGLYVNALFFGYDIPNLNEESLKLRNKLEKLSLNSLLEKLKIADPLSAQKIDPKNKRRLIRALEVTLLSKQPFSKLQKKQKPKYNTLIIGIDIDRETLYAKVDARVEQMIKDGLVEEVRELAKKYPSDLPALNTIGYREIVEYIKSKTTLKEAIQKIKYNTHDYIRRQITWFRKNKDIVWVRSYDQAEKRIQRFLKF